MFRKEMSNNMATMQAIIGGIDQRVKSSKEPNYYKAWQIGITQDVQQRYKDWGTPQYFQYWEADSLQDAQAIEAHFINQKGMKGGTGGDLSPKAKTYVYIF